MKFVGPSPISILMELRTGTDGPLYGVPWGPSCSHFLYRSCRPCWAHCSARSIPMEGFALPLTLHGEARERCIERESIVLRISGRERESTVLIATASVISCSYLQRSQHSLHSGQCFHLLSSELTCFLAAWRPHQHVLQLSAGVASWECGVIRGIKEADNDHKTSKIRNLSWSVQRKPTSPWSLWVCLPHAVSRYLRCIQIVEGCRGSSSIFSENILVHWRTETHKHVYC